MFLQNLGWRNWKTPTLIPPPSTGSQCKVGLGQNGTVINEETIKGVSYRAISSCGASFGSPSSDSLAYEPSSQAWFRGLTHPSEKGFNAIKQMSASGTWLSTSPQPAPSFLLPGSHCVRPLLPLSTWAGPNNRQASGTCSKAKHGLRDVELRRDLRHQLDEALE